jgi:hypothetical protein
MSTGVGLKASSAIARMTSSSRSRAYAPFRPRTTAPASPAGTIIVAVLDGCRTKVGIELPSFPRILHILETVAPKLVSAPPIVAQMTLPTVERNVPDRHDTPETESMDSPDPARHQS